MFDAFCFQDSHTMHFWALLFLVLMLWSASVKGFGGADDRYIKKYAMMKVRTFLRVCLVIIWFHVVSHTAKNRHICE
jgi:hypothetical protein